MQSNQSDAVGSFAVSHAGWRIVTDTVMGGISSAQLVQTVVDGVDCLKMTGQVSLENNGGFVQASRDFDLQNGGVINARKYRGIELKVYGNGERYNLHLRTADTKIVWQSYRVSFLAEPRWRTLRFAFEDFSSYRIQLPLDTTRLRRVGVVGIGKVMQVDVCFAGFSFYS